MMMMMMMMTTTVAVVMTNTYKSIQSVPATYTNVTLIKLNINCAILLPF
jgi:hypothetical protein